MKNSILLIRHAQSANNALPESQRVPDPGLTELGHRQAGLLAQSIHRFPITQLYCSPFRRSLETTRPLADALAMPPMIHSEIYEQGGCYTGYEPGQLRGAPGMNRAELVLGYPGWSICDSIGHQGWNHGREYETDLEVQQRANRIATWLAGPWLHVSPGALAGLVIHADFKRVLMIAMLGADQWPDHWHPIYNTAVSHLRRVGDRWELIEWNSVEHLPAELRSD